MTQPTTSRGAASNLNLDAGNEPLDPADGAALHQASLSSALGAIFRGKFCDSVLLGRDSLVFERGDVLFEVGDRDRTLFFIRRGFVKVGTVTQDGREIIFDIRKAGDVAGELCACQFSRGTVTLTSCR